MTERFNCTMLAHLSLEKEEIDEERNNKIIIFVP